MSILGKSLPVAGTLLHRFKITADQVKALSIEEIHPSPFIVRLSHWHRYKLDKSAISNDLTADRPLYILSAYGPGRDAPQQLFGGQPREQSFEELRLRHYELSSIGNEAQAIQEAQVLYSNAEQQIHKALADLDGAIKYITDSANRHPNRLDMCQAKGSDPPQSQQPPSGPQASSSGAFATRSSAFGQPSFGQASTPAPAPAFGQPSFAPPSAPAPAPAFGKPSFGQDAPPTSVSAFGNPAFGQAAGPAPAFGQPTAPSQKPTTFGQLSNPSAAPAFGQPSLPSSFAQPQQSAFVQQQPQQQSAFGRPNTAFGQQPSSGVPTSGAFGQQPATATSNPFVNAPTASSAFNQPKAAPANAFGQPAAPQPSGSFGQPSASQATTNPFGSRDSGQTPSDSNQSKPSPAPAFGQPAAPVSAGMFGGPSAPASSTALATPLVPPNAGASTNATFGPGNPNDRKLLSWQGLRVEYVDKEPSMTSSEDADKEPPVPCIKNAEDGGWQRIWFPEGPITFTSKTPEYPDGYIADEATIESFKHFKQHGVGSNGLIPDMPPPRNMINWNF
ncbi:MAG: hypothetical protein Q9200_000751 [Gallowayella weberi]